MTGGIFILLGSNQGDKRKNINDAINLVNRKAGYVLKKSSLYKTVAWGKEDQADFYNIVIEIESGLKPPDLLNVLLEIENQLGRVRRIKWESRSIDLDILYYKDLVIDTERLQIPHPEIQNRNFTLVPLVEIAKEFKHPFLDKSNLILLNECLDELAVTKLK